MYILDKLRSDINKLDKELLHILSKRFDIIKKVGHLKYTQGISIYVPEREIVILDNIKKESIKLGICSNFIEKILTLIMDESHIIENNCGYKKLSIFLKSIVIIGNKDFIGILFQKMFLLSGYDVLYISCDDITLYLQKLKISSVIIIMVPVTALFIDIIKKLPNLSKHCNLIILSVVNPINILQEIKNKNIRSALILHIIYNFSYNSILAKQLMIYYMNEDFFIEEYKWFIEQIKLWGVLLYSQHEKNQSDIIQSYDLMQCFYYTIFALCTYIIQKKIDIKKIKILFPVIYEIYRMYSGYISNSFMKELRDIIISNTNVNVLLYLLNFCEYFSKSIDSLKNNIQNNLDNYKLYDLN